MRQLKKTLLTLVALLAVTTGAWATDVYVVGNGEGNWLNGAAWDPAAAANKMTEQNGVYSITFTDVDDDIGLQFKFALNGVWAVNYGCSSTTEIKLNKTISNIEDGKNITFRLTEPADVTISFNLSELTFMISTKGMKVGDDTPPVPLTRGTGDKINEWTLTNGMPAGNVTVRAHYYAQAELAKSTGETPELLAPAAIDGVPANTDAPIVTAGAVANIGTSEVKQGTLMYFVKQADGNTAPDAPDYDDDGWTDKVPTANGLAEGKAYVWYYIKGAEPAQGTGRTDDNTRSDSDIMPLGTTGYVTLLPEPTYTVSLNQTDLAEGEPAKWSAKSTNVAEVNLGEADLEGVKRNETVTVTYSGSKKIIGVKAEKIVKIKSFSIQRSSASVDPGGTVTFTIVNIQPADATNQTFEWSFGGTPDATIESISDDTKTVTVKAGNSVSPITIKATAKDGSGTNNSSQVFLQQ